MDFYDIHDQSKYQITVSKPENMEDLSDLFVTQEELEDMIGTPHLYLSGSGKRTLLLESVIKAEVKKLCEELDASGKKTLLIEDEDLLDVLKQRYISDFDSTYKYGRHGNRLCYARRYKRVKKKATQGDVRKMWHTIFPYAFWDKYGCHPPHIPTWNRSVQLFEALKKIVGWRRVRKRIEDPAEVKFFRQIWDNPREFIR